MSIQKITKMAIVIALYVVLTYAFSFMSYGNIQFRIAEVLILLVFYKKDYAIPLVIACAIANILSPLGIIDVAFGTLGTLFAALGIILVSQFKQYFRHEWTLLFIASLMPVIANAIFVGYELQIVYGYGFWPTAFSVAIGEFAVVSILGVLAFTAMRKNSAFMAMIETDASVHSIDDRHDH